MNFNNKFLWLVLPVFILSACNLQFAESPQDPDAANLELTAIVQQMLIDQAAQQVNIVEITATPEPGSAENVSPTEEVVIPAAVLPPATGDVTVTVSTATNCRQGPSAAFASVYGMPVGQVAKVVAKNSYSGYWIIEIPSQAGQTCWLWGQYATITGDTASLKDVVTPTSVATLKPTATNTPTVTATNTVSAGAQAVAGCTSSTASNYNPAATVDDGSCIFTAQATILGCTDPAATNYNSNANSDDGSCVYQSPPNMVIVNSSVICTDQQDGNFEFHIIINWTDSTSAPNDNRSYRRSTKWTDQNGNSISGSNSPIGLGESHWENTAIRPAGATYSFTVKSSDGTSSASTSLTCP